MKSKPVFDDNGYLKAIKYKEPLEKLEVHTYQVTKLGRVKNEHHGFLCGECVDQILALSIPKSVVEELVSKIEPLIDYEHQHKFAELKKELGL